ncbi:YkvA family protein [Parasporobacterium paucivorans]|uniref:DUF1232 domain-containing protein n=1 Tax=Parasporobacterium paucivorans DSM 15970 TaxID=1122934 RepID=A0A1M6CXF4_9FIRM|nr:YkvA family protein [Parasporobacterium paucivorans]SHI65667.1 Protein of unknown function [Parasporobacterium paucivorans DSM 15970]
MNLKEKAKALKIYIPALFIAMKRKDTPLAAKIFAGITVGYALSPIDLIPDFIPVLGYLDDIVILPLLASLAIKFIPNEIMEECKAEAEEMWKDGKPIKWYYAIPIILFWILVAAVVFNILI